MSTRWEYQYAQRMQNVSSSIIRELLKLTQRPEVISFAGGLPSPDTFPVEKFQQAAEKVLREQSAQALQYGATEGYSPLREMIARHASRYGIQVTPDHILITNGSQQALDLLGKLFIDPGDKVLVEKPTYLGALQAWNAYQPHYLSVPLDDDGMQIPALKLALKAKPKFIYALPNFQNPAGVTLALERRGQLIALAEEHGIPIVEDDPYGQLRYEGDHLPSLVSLDAKMRSGGQGYAGNVIYLSTFSKTLAPGLRLGWVVAPTNVIQQLTRAKQGADLHTSTFVQMVAYETARGGFLDEHVRQIRKLYKQRRDAMLAALERHFPKGVRWTHPAGGLFLWVTLPEGTDTAELLQVAIKEDVAFVPGHAFFADGSGKNTMRLNFSYSPPDIIEEGIRRLGRALDHALAQVAVH